ncbi:MAG TPA: FtsX-like permease family protein, partial [Bryobacteraceae bacterium]|nr:FtsX-like permease family protein [Bryobacteraceae bacterium]
AAFRPSTRGTFVVRASTANPLAFASVLRREISSARPELRVGNIRTQTQIIDSHLVRERLLATLALFFAGVAILLAGIGLYGVLDYSVLERRREIGIRMAIGARATQIARGVATGVLITTLAGALIGVALGSAAAAYIQALLFEVRASNLSSIVLPAITIAAAAFAASLPAVVRAIRTDPAQTLRSE